MKRIITVLVGISLLFALGSCSNGGDPVDYMIEFTVDGTTTYVLQEAYGDASEVSKGAYKPSHSATYIIAETDAEGVWVSLTVSGNSAGIYQDAIDDVMFNFSRGSENDYRDNTSTDEDFTINITRYGGVGGVIEGTFSGTCEEYEYPSMGMPFYNGTTHTITDGHFVVLHATEDEIADFFK